MISCLTKDVFSDDEPFQEHTRLFNVVAICVVAWFTPIVRLGLTRGWDDILVREAIFFSNAAMMTFGGAYSVLAYLAKRQFTTTDG